MEARVCDVCGKVKAENICVICGRDTCKKCKRAPVLKMEPNTIHNYQTTRDVFKMCTFNFCLNCYQKIPWNNKEEIEDENITNIILEQLKKRIMAEELVKASNK